jgi:hypothetical protein
MLNDPHDPFPEPFRIENGFFLFVRGIDIFGNRLTHGNLGGNAAGIHMQYESDGNTGNVDNGMD